MKTLRNPQHAADWECGKTVVKSYVDLVSALAALVDNASVQAAVLKVNTPHAASLPDLLAALGQARAVLASATKANL